MGCNGDSFARVGPQSREFPGCLSSVREGRRGRRLGAPHERLRGPRHRGGTVQPADLEQYIRRHIPLSRAMAVSVVAAGSDAVALQAPLAPNINHRQTAFGGSEAALAILASWALLHVRLQADGIADHLVIQRNSMEYRRPVLGEFSARAVLAHPERWQQFLTMLASKGRARVTVSTVLECAGETAGTFTGDFVAFAA